MRSSTPSGTIVLPVTAPSHEKPVAARLAGLPVTEGRDFPQGQLRVDPGEPDPGLGDRQSRLLAGRRCRAVQLPGPGPAGMVAFVGVHLDVNDRHEIDPSAVTCYRVLPGKWRHQFARIGQRFQPTNCGQRCVDAVTGKRPHRVAGAVAEFRLELGIGERLFR